MPIINLTTLQDVLGGTVGVTSELTAIAARGYGLPPRRTGEAIVYPQQITITFIDGVPNQQLVLTTLPAGYYWKIVVFHPSDPPYRVNALVPAGAGPFNFSELISVNPRTCAPLDGAMEQAYLDQITNAISSIDDALPFITVAVPTSSVGQVGDVIGRGAISNGHIYYCTGTYDGTTNIWKRVAWSGDTW